MLRDAMNVGKHAPAVLLLVLLSGCASAAPGDVATPYGVYPATVFGAPEFANVFFQSAQLAGAAGGPFYFTTDPAAGHTPTSSAYPCTGTTTFEGDAMTIDWACDSPTRTATISGTLTWRGDHYQGDCTTSYTSSSLSFSNLVVPFRGIE